MILGKQSKGFEEFSTETFTSTTNLIKLLDKRNTYKEDLLKVFNVQEDKTEIFKIGNAKLLIDSIIDLDSKCEKIDVDKEIKNIYLKKLLEDEKATFEVFKISNDFILSNNNNSDLLLVETRYSAKNDLLEYYNFSKFANYCRDKEYNDLIDTVKEYLRSKNIENNEELKLKLLYRCDDKKFFLRAITSTQGYKDFGINFSIFVAIVSLGRYVEKSKSEIFIDNYTINDSEVYVSFRLMKEIKLPNNLSLSISLILENDEIKRSAVSFNGVCKLSYSDKNNKHSEIYIKPKGLKKTDQSYAVDLLTYPHRGSVEKVYEKITELPSAIELFIKQVSEDAPKISSIEKPNDVKEYIATKVKNSKKPEFKEFKEKILKILMRISADNIFNLFELLREVDELFEHKDVLSRDFWRTKLYEALIERK